MSTPQDPKQHTVINFMHTIMNRPYMEAEVFVADEATLVGSFVEQYKDLNVTLPREKFVNDFTFHIGLSIRPFGESFTTGKYHVEKIDEGVFHAHVFTTREPPLRAKKETYTVLEIRVNDSDKIYYIELISHDTTTY